jgi:hypothetical protein
MRRFSAVAAGSREWAALVHRVDARTIRLSLTDVNRLLDNLLVAVDAEREARALRLDRLTRLSSFRRPRP